jgi:uncharacterized RDD family membrane protein YckC
MAAPPPERAAPAVVTPEAVALAHDDATAGTRGIAALIDLALVGVALLAVALAAMVTGNGAAAPGWAGLTAALVLGSLALFGYPVGFETLWRGRTPGKAALGLRVVTVEGGPVALRHAAIRAAVGLIELRASAGAIALLASLLSRRGQRLGDHVAGTVVVREGSRRRRTQPLSVTVPPDLAAYAQTIEPAGLPPADYDAVRRFLQRRGELTPQARAPLAERLADRVAADLGHRRDPSVAAERFLRCVAARVQERETPPAGASRAG